MTTQVRNGILRANTRLVGQVCEQLAVSNWVWRMAQLGYAAKGLLYVIVGGTALMAVLSLGRRVRGTSGALNFMLASPFGRLGVAVIVVGLCGFILRRFVQVFVPPTTGTPPRLITRVSRRIGYVLSGLAHLGIALTALELVLGLRSFSGGSASKGVWMPLLASSQFFGTSVIRVAGLVIVGFAIFQFYLAVTRRFAIELRVDQMTEQVRNMTFGFGVAGHVGRGVAFFITGAFLVYAGWFVADLETGGLGQTLRTFQSAPFGIWIFFAVAAGLTAYGLYLLLAAFYLRLISTW